MSDAALIAASTWAHEHAAKHSDPVDFGNKVALVYCACKTTQHHAGDEKATAAALASLSIRPEVLQAIAQLAVLIPLNSAQKCQTPQAGV